MTARFEIELGEGLANPDAFYATADLARSALAQAYRDHTLEAAPRPSTGAPRAAFVLRRGVRVGALVRLRLDGRVMSVEVKPSAWLDVLLARGVALVGVCAVMSLVAFFAALLAPTQAPLLRAIATTSGGLAALVALLVGYGALGRGASARASDALAREIGQRLEQAWQHVFRRPR